MPPGSTLLAGPAAAAAGLGVPPLALAAFSAAALLLVLEHRRANLGIRATAAFVAASCGYGFVRSLSIRWLADAHLGGVPYRLSSPVATIAGVPLQELVGWTAAAGLAGYFADRLLRRFGQPTDPWRTSLLAGIAMAAICLVVETAATVGGWWSWSLAHSPNAWLRFPAIGLVDWGFVAIDFLLPFELWSRGAPRAQRTLGLLLFPIHLMGHALTQRLPGPVPLSGFDLVHVALIAAVIAGAAASNAASPWPSVRQELLRSRPAMAVGILLATAAVQDLMVRQPALLWTCAPLAALAVVAVLLARDTEARTSVVSKSTAVAIFAGCLLLGLAVRLPSARRGRDFEELVRQAAESLTAQRGAEAVEPLQRALALRPDDSEALWLLGWAEMQRGNRAAARTHLQAALVQRPDAPEAARLLAALDRAER
jgi:Tetratricopeptide repeat